MGCKGVMMGDAFCPPWLTAAPFRKIEYQIRGPLSVEDKCSAMCVEPISVTDTCGFEGGWVSFGSLTVTELLGRE